MEHPCRTCGACCASLRVTFDEQEVASRGGTVPDALTVRFDPRQRAMRGTSHESRPRCVALEGTIGEWTTCGIHPRRPTPCRKFTASYVDGKRSAPCDLARETHGLLPLEPSVWERYRALRKKQTLEEPVRLGRSTIWALNRAFYASKGPRAWASDIVPFGVSTHPRVATTYAHLVVAFLREAGALVPDEPVHVVELGSGPGRFTHLLSREIDRVRDALPSGSPAVTVVATDFAESNLDWIDAHPTLQASLEGGRVDVARFDGDDPAPLELRRSRRRLAPGSLKNPLVIVANYILDSLATDAFRIHDGVVEDVLVAVTKTDEPTDDETRLEGYALSTLERPVVGPAYDDPVLESIIEEYRAQIVDSGVWFPVGAIAAVRYLASLTDRPVLLLVGDKSFRTVEELQRRSVASLVTHGSISVTVNAHALQRVFEAAGGFAMHASNPDTSFTFSAFALPRGGDFGGTRLAFRREIEGFGPRESHLLVWSLRGARLSPASALHVLRASGCDPMAFRIWFPVVLPALEEADFEMRKQVLAVLDEVASNDFWLGTRGDGVAVLLEKGYRAVGDDERAAAWSAEARERDKPEA